MPDASEWILVAGASGMAGRAIVAELLRHPGARVRAVHFNQEYPFASEPRVEPVRADLRDAAACAAAVRGCARAVFAAAVTGGAAQQASEPWRQVNDNLIMNARLLEAAAGEKLRQVVLIGSATCYQPFEGAIREDELNWEQDPPESYFGIGWVTRYMEKQAQFWRRKTGLNVVCVRAANIFGPFAQFNPATANFIPALIRKAVARENPFEVWGSPGVARDVVPSADFARAIAGLLYLESAAGGVFNVGSGRATTVGDVVQWVLDAAGHHDAVVRCVADRPAPTHNRVLDCAKLRATLPGLPAIEIEPAVRATLAWWTVNQNSWKR